MFYCFVRLWLLSLQPLHQPAVLLRCQGLHFLCTSGPLETATFQTLIQQQKAISLPVQRLDPVPSPPAEQKQRPLKRVHLELALYQIYQPVNASPRICVPTGNVHRAAAVEIIQHDFAAWRIASSAASPAPEYTWTRIPLTYRQPAAPARLHTPTSFYQSVLLVGSL